MENIKRQLYDLCKIYIEQRILTAKQAIAASQQAANNETKSSSGDKYETGRAMAQLDIEKDSAQLSESLKLRHALDQIRIDQAPTSVQPGTLVTTSYGVFFMGISLGKITVDDKTYLAISPASPIEKKMMGLKLKDSFALNNQTYIVQEIQ